VRIIVFFVACEKAALYVPMFLELSGGGVIKGDLLSSDNQQAVVKAEFEWRTFRRDHLNQATIQRLELFSRDPEKLPTRILPRFRHSSL
jgi:hypothetical protein